LVGQNLDFNTEIFVCGNCGLIQNDFISKAYLDDYYHHRYRQQRKEEITENYIKFMHRRGASQYDFILEHLPEEAQLGTVLDIGASAGKLLEMFPPSSRVFAVESDAAMVAHMGKNPAITVLEDDILFSKENHGAFDMIAMSHVFEHINNPLEYLYQLHKILSEDGLVFLEVPNEPLHVVSHYINKKKKGIGHLFDYTIETLGEMIRRSQLFEICALETYSVSVSDYLKGASIMNFEKNKTGDGIHIRVLLRRLNTVNSNREYNYIDSVLQSRYRSQLIYEKRMKIAQIGWETIDQSFKKIKTLINYK
jgi:SAM-dependent methyltransferase